MKSEILTGITSVASLVGLSNLAEYYQNRYKSLPLIESQYGLETAIGIAEILIQNIDEEPLHLKLVGNYGAMLGARHYLRDVRS